MTSPPTEIDARVVIGQVRIRAWTGGPRPPLAGQRPPEPARAGDHRIIVRALCVETDAALSEHDARGLGERLERALGEQLEAVQARRVSALLAGRSRGGSVRVDTLRVVLRGEAAVRPDLGAVATALAGAVERRCPS